MGDAGGFLRHSRGAREVVPAQRCWVGVGCGWREHSLARIPHLAQTSDAVNRQLSCFSSRYMNLLAVFQI